MVCRFAENKRKLVVSVFRLQKKQREVAVFRWFRFSFAEFRKHRAMEMETWKHGKKTDNGSPGDLP
jgi:hypothetical protein